MLSPDHFLSANNLYSISFLINISLALRLLEVNHDTLDKKSNLLQLIFLKIVEQKLFRSQSYRSKPVVNVH